MLRRLCLRTLGGQTLAAASDKKAQESRAKGQGSTPMLPLSSRHPPSFASCAKNSHPQLDLPMLLHLQVEVSGLPTGAPSHGLSRQPP